MSSKDRNGTSDWTASDEIVPEVGTKKLSDKSNIKQEDSKSPHISTRNYLEIMLSNLSGW